MKFPLLVNAFGHRKLILEMGGNAVGVSEPQFQPQQHRRHRVNQPSSDNQNAKRSDRESTQANRSM